MKKFINILCILWLLPFVLWAQQDSSYWNHQSLLIPWRPAPVSDPGTIEYIDLDGDGLTEMTIRMVDTPTFKYRRGDENAAKDPYDYQFTKKFDGIH